MVDEEEEEEDIVEQDCVEIQAAFDDHFSIDQLLERWTRDTLRLW